MFVTLSHIARRKLDAMSIFSPSRKLGVRVPGVVIWQTSLATTLSNLVAFFVPEMADQKTGI